MSDLLERLRDMAAGKHDDLEIAAEAIEEIIDLHWRVVQLEDERDKLAGENRLQQERCRLYHNTVEAANSIINELSAKIAAHEKVCAGTWVPVGERLPETDYLTVIDGGVLITDVSFKDNKWSMACPVYCREQLYKVTHWLDAKEPQR